MYLIIKNISDEVVKIAFRHYAEAIFLLKNPTFEDWISALRRKGYLLNNIKENEILREYIEESLYSRGENIKLIKNPSEDLQLRAVMSDPYSIRFINNPSDKAKCLAVSSDGWAIQYIKDPTEEMKLKAVENKPNSLKLIEDYSDEICISALKGDPKVASFIKYPSKKVKEFMEELSKKRIVWF